MAAAQLIFARYDPLERDRWLAATEGWVTAAELERSPASGDRDVRARHLIGRAALRLLVAELSGIAEPLTVTVAQTPEGKPYLPDRPELQVSVAHSDDVIAVTACEGAAVGVDVDSLGRQTPDVQRLVARVFAEQEAQRFAQLGPEAAQVEFMRYWMIKEAVGKALGVGYPPALRGAEIEPAQPDGDVHGPLRLKSVWSGPRAESWTLHWIDLPDGDEQVVIAVAIPDAVLNASRRLTPTGVQPVTQG